MSRVGQWRVALQEMAEYSDGADAFARGEPGDIPPAILADEARTAYRLGWSDAREESVLAGGAGNHRTYEE